MNVKKTLARMFSACAFTSLPLSQLILADFSVAETLSGASEESIPEMIITANRFEEETKEVGSTYNLVQSQEIKERRDFTLADTLRSVPGLQVTQSGGPGRTTSVFLRGAGSSQSLVMVDGIPINENLSGQFDFADFNSLGVKKVEVLKGAQSTLYGSDALGGVINIITEGPSDEESLTLNTEAGSYGEQRYQATTTGGTENLKGFIGTSWFSLHGTSVAETSNNNPENDPYSAASVVGKATATIEDVEITPTFRYLKSNSELDGFDFATGSIDALDYRQRRESVQSSLKFGQVEKEEKIFFNPTLVLAYNSDYFKGLDPETSFNNYAFKSTNYNVQQQNVFKFSDDITTLLGYSYERNDGNSLEQFNKSRDINSIFADQKFSPFEGTNLTAGAREDFDSSFGNIFTYRLTASQSFEAVSSRVHTSYGTGYRAPTLSDLYFPGFSNPNLDAEKSQSYDVGFETTTSYFKSDITFFYNNFDDLISFDVLTNAPENIQSAYATGIESKVSFKVSQYVEPTLSYTYLDSENRDSNSVLPRRARHQGGLSLRVLPVDNLVLRTDVIGIADRIDSDGKNMDDYILVNAVTEYSGFDYLTPYIRVQNLLDKDYQEIPGYGTYGASIIFGIQTRL